jgi:hypothetical protein
LAEKLEKMEAEQKRLLAQMKADKTNSDSTLNGKKAAQQNESILWRRS